MIASVPEQPGLSKERREYQLRWQKNQRATDNEISLPEVIYPDLRNEFAEDLEAFLRKGFPDIFPDPFGQCQKDSIRYTQEKIAKGGRNLNILEPRAYGKTSRGVIARVWGILNGHIQLSIVAGSSQAKATNMMRLVNFAVSRNQILLGCYPELWAFHAIGGNSMKSVYQTYKGTRTELKLRSSEVQFADLGEEWQTSRSQMFIVPFENTRGIMVEGRRVDDVLLDDIQKTKDAVSPAAIQKLLLYLDSDIAFLGSRADPVSITNNATIIRPDDFPDILTRRKSFKTVRYKMVEQFPSGEKARLLWEQYEEIRQTFDESIEDDDLRAKRDALEHYKANRKAMDGDSVVTWDFAYSRKEYDFEISTIQAAYNFKIDWGEDAFLSECQNDPPKQTFESDELTRTHICEKQHGQVRGVVPQEAEYLVNDIDVQGECVFSTEVAGSEKFDAFVINYSTFPDQKSRQFTKSKLKHTFSKKYKGADEDSKIYQGVREFLEIQCAKEFRRDGDNALKKFDVLAVDVKWNERVIRRAIRDVGDPRILAYNGHGIGPTKAPMASWKKGDGEKKGIHWHLRAAKQGVRNFVSDVNFWKTFVKKHFLIPLGQTGSLSVFKTDSPNHHDLYSRHIKSEVGKTMTDDATSRKIEVWTALPGQDNDWLDTTVGCMALLSFCGAECLGAEREKKPTKKRKSRYL